MDKKTKAWMEKAPAMVGPMPLIKKLVLFLGAVLLLLGAGLSFTGGGSGGQTGVSSQQADGEGLATGLDADGNTIGGTTQAGDSGEGASGLGSYSPFFVKGGFSLLVGFCIGYALRAFFKISAIVLGALLIVLFGLQYFELIHIDWMRLDGMFDAIVDTVRTEFEGFRSFITGSLPSAALATTGMVVGFKKHR